MSEYEQKIAASLEALQGPHWYRRRISPAMARALLDCETTTDREKLVADMKAEAVAHAHSILQAGIHAGLVKVA